MVDLLTETLDLFDVNNSTNLIVDPILGSTLLAYKRFTSEQKNILIYTKNNNDGQKIYNLLTRLVDPDDVLLINSDELLRVEYISESKEMVSELIYSLYKLRNKGKGIYIVNPSVLLRYYPSTKLFDESFLDLEVNKEINREDLKKKLAEVGYIRVNKIDQSLEFASRGEIIDIFSLNFENPLRIEFFDNLIESIRMFDISTQESFRKYEKVNIIPATLNLLTEEEKNEAEDKIKKLLFEDLSLYKKLDQEKCQSNTFSDIDEIKTNVFSSRLYKYYGFLQNKHTSFINYASNFEVIVAGKTDFEKAIIDVKNDANKFLFELRSDNKCLSKLSYFNEGASLYSGSDRTYVIDTIFSQKKDKIVEICEVNFLNPAKNSPKYVLNSLINSNLKMLILAQDEAELNVIKTLCEEEGIAPSITQNFEFDEDNKISISINKIGISFELQKRGIVILSSKDLLNSRTTIRNFTTRFKKGKILKTYEELENGDYVVHEKYGIGRFSKIETIEVLGKKNDYIEIFYANNDKLYVPLYQFNMIRKYVGKEGTIPKLTNLHSNQWDKTKQRIKNRVNELADRLLILYQERAEIPGFSFKKDDDIQLAFEKDFEHELTKDQVTSINEIKEDMEAPHPMDRLLCGDVGFGKTEVAFEAAMKAILSEKQVLLLCPTTVLASQHFRVAQERFRNFKINIKLLSRMVTDAEAKKVFESAADGTLNFLIGTHRALNNELNFKDLGLLIIDEEQRFGVEQKEKIKEKYKNVDTLTLSATPIPRTLQSGLVGLKKISRIESAPVERLPIQTYVVNYDKNLVKELIQRELNRDGQVFYVCNKIERLDEKAENIQKMVENAKIGIIHGKMNREEIDSIMESFYVGEINVLLATTIIENGIDVRNANLLIVEDADMFGLSQLYQIKGRVGRGDKIAYAYLMVNPKKTLNEEAKKRLKSITDFTELGSGYKIAQRDLLIRGAGDILGKEQAGFIDEVGIDLYIKILNDTIKERQSTGKMPEKKNFKSLSEIEAYIPTTFADTDQKLELYQQILEITQLEELAKVKKQITDQYGKLPPNVELLFLKTEISLYLNQEEFKELIDYETNVDIVLSKKFTEFDGIGTALFTATIRYMNKAKLFYFNKEIHIKINKNDTWIDTLYELVKIIHTVYEETKKKKVVIADEA